MATKTTENKSVDTKENDLGIDLKKANLWQKIALVKQRIGKIYKSADNPFFKSKYFDINILLEHLEPLLFEYRLMTIQPVIDGNVCCRIIDIDNPEHVYESKLELPKLTDPQKTGSAITYYRRYGLTAMLGLQAEDDDGNKAGLKGDQDDAAREAKVKAAKLEKYIVSCVNLILSSKTPEELAENCKKATKVKGEKRVLDAAAAMNKKLKPKEESKQEPVAETEKEQPSKRDQAIEKIINAVGAAKNNKELSDIWKKVPESLKAEERIIVTVKAKKFPKAAKAA